MALWNFIIYAKTDFSSVDFNGNIVTNSVITPIHITVEDNDGWLGGPTGYFADTDGQQTIVAASDPSLIGRGIELHHPNGNSAETTLFDNSGATGIVIVDLSIGGVDGYVLALDGGVNGELSPSTTYTDTDPRSGQSGINYMVHSLPCYAPGTLIDTPDGPRAVETLMPGDRVMTLDHGPQPILWTSLATQPLAEAEVEARPVLIKAGALGHNLPAQDLIVSPQHRILVGGAGQLQPIFGSVALVPAKSLTSLRGIRHMMGKTSITWVHFACDRHEVVYANGCLSETLLLGPMVVNGLPSAERRALTDIFGPAPAPDVALNGPPARDCLTVGAARRQITRHLQEKGARLLMEIRKWDRDLAMENCEAERRRKAASSAQYSEKARHIA